jgi:hypothetical protein
MKPYTLRTPAGAGGLAATTATLADSPVGQAYGLHVERIEFAFYVLTTNSGSHYWTFTAFIDDGTTRTNLGNVNTSAKTHDKWETLSLTSFSANDWAAANQRVLNVDVGVTGSPGNLYPAFDLYYRLIYT